MTSRHQQHEDPGLLIERAEHVGLEPFPHRLRGGVGAEQRRGGGIGQADAFPDHRQAGVQGNEAEHHARGDLLDRIPGLDGLVAHHEHPAGEDEQRPLISSPGCAGFGTQ
jgi:hypothetical protein